MYQIPALMHQEVWMRDLSARTDNVFQLTSDGLRHYQDAVDAHFATDVHFAQLVKLFSTPDITGPDWFGQTSRVTGTIPSVRCGRPDPRFVSTSHVERLNLSVRMHLRRFATSHECAQPQAREPEIRCLAVGLLVQLRAAQFSRENDARDGGRNRRSHLDDEGMLGTSI